MTFTDYCFYSLIARGPQKEGIASLGEWLRLLSAVRLIIDTVLQPTARQRDRGQADRQSRNVSLKANALLAFRVTFPDSKRSGAGREARSLILLGSEQLYRSEAYSINDAPEESYAFS